MKYRMMVVDDEYQLVHCFKNNIDWDEYGMEYAGDADSAADALELYSTIHPEIILMDINLPDQNGLDVSSQILSIDRDVKIIIISGHNDFDYAQKAIGIGVFEYLTKPLQKEDIVNSVIKARDVLEKLRQERLSSENALRLLHESLPLLRERYLANILSGKNTGQDLFEKLAGVGIDIVNDYYNCAVMQGEEKDAVKDGIDSISGLIQVAIEDIFEKKTLKYATCFYNHKFVIIYSYDESLSRMDFNSFFAVIRNKIRFLCNIGLYIGIGRETEKFDELAYSFSSAEDALNYRGICCQDGVVDIRDAIDMTTYRFFPQKDEINGLADSFKGGEFGSFKKRLDLYFNKVIALGFSIQYLQKLCVEMLAYITMICEEIDKDVEARLADANNYTNPYLEIFGIFDHMALKKYVLKYFEVLMGLLNQSRNDKVSNSVDLARKYIKNHFADHNLCLGDIATHIGMSQAYLSHLFKQHSGVSFVEYLNDIRIQEAKRLLKRTNMKVYEVADKVGYNDPRHFNNLFRKQTNTTPAEYRNQFAQIG